MISLTRPALLLLSIPLKSWVEPGDEASAARERVKVIVSCYRGRLPAKEAIRPHAFAINVKSHMLAIVYPSVSNVVLSSPTTCVGVDVL